ncbi:hypothetical protein SAMN05421774_101858 [Gemmobacter megaterium]|uniref:Uncharacterized protein n=1 Tax=Gemmobacter megaterium TaxID=1086013 RepID=A0A1N7L2N5_9RHOB|nr:hypothetical protein [Gemmobacter megaterium]SIS68016.1 hypothetical protein SAMN05421774_101858 [Gemmobacter megaterium]
MEFWSAAEGNGVAIDRLHEVRHLIESQINALISLSELKSFSAKVRYIPIIMTADRRDRYPARSRVERKNRIYNCCPQLDYDAFVSGSPVERVAIYIDGLRGCGPGLAKLGATSEQVTEFDRILDETLQIVTEQLNRPSPT